MRAYLKNLLVSVAAVFGVAFLATCLPAAVAEHPRTALRLYGALALCMLPFAPLLALILTAAERADSRR